MDAYEDTGGWSELRIGLGNDLHRIVPGQGLTLGGVLVPCAWRALAVSDGDVVLHALVDALLGACAMGDIGEYYPEKAVVPGESSRRFVEETLLRLRDKTPIVLNLDCVISLETPRLSPYKQAIRENLSGLLRLDIDRINVKAKTAEGQGAVGRSEAVTAQVIVLLRLGGDR